MTGVEKAWPLSSFTGGRVINDRVDVLQLVLIGDAKTRIVRAYRSEGRKFEKISDKLNAILNDSEKWQVTETALIGS